MKLVSLVFVFLFLIPVVHSAVKVNVDFDTMSDSINIQYAAQDPEWTKWTINSTNISQNHKEIGTTNYRIWIHENASAGYYDRVIKTISINKDCKTYNYKNLSNVTAWALYNGFVPHFTIRKPPRCMGGTYLPLENDTAWGNYCSNLTKYFYNQCTNNGGINWTNKSGHIETISCGDFSKWRWEIGNEFLTNYYHGKDNNASRIYSVCYNAIKSSTPSAKAGSPGHIADDYEQEKIHGFYNNLSVSEYPDFFGFHMYDRAYKTNPSQPGYTGLSFYDFLNDTKKRYYTDFQWIMNRVYSHDADVQIYNFEYNIASYYDPHPPEIQDERGSVWYASALYWQIQTTVLGESWFEGTDKSHEFGMWNFSGQKKKVFYTKAGWVKRLPNSTMYYLGTTNESLGKKRIESVSAKNSTIIINKYNLTTPVSLNLNNKDIRYIFYNSSKRLIDRGGFFNLTLNPYEVGFIDHGCTYGGSGPGLINTSTGCDRITSNMNLNGNNLRIQGNGSIIVSGNINNGKVIYKGISSSNKLKVIYQ